MEDFSVQPLSKGLGFYENTTFDKTEGADKHPLLRGKTSVRGQKLSPLLAQIPESLLQETTTPQKEGDYEKLRALLEKPYLSKTTDGGRALSWDEHSYPPIPAESSSAKSSHPQKKGTDNKAFSSKAEVPDFQPTVQSPIALDTGALKKISPWLRAVGLMDVLTAGLLFFPSFMLFAFLTETAVLPVLSLLWLKILLAFLFFVQMYCFVCRLFCFETLGEALAKIRLAPKGSKGPAHPLSLFFHFVLSCATGFVLLPLLSLVLKKDLSGYLTGLQFQKTT